MRIVSGKYRGKRIIAPKKLPVRPTTDQAKEALFDILWNRIDFEEISVLDLFSGTGNIAYEFASRGTTDITAVDQFYGCVKFIKKTAAALGADITPIKRDVYTFLTQSSRAYDIVFADPPYQFSDEEFAKIVQLVFEHKHVSSTGMLIIEHSKHTDLSTLIQFTESRRYGGSIFSFFTYQ